ncbi:alanyl-tRNA editing protein [Halalkalicoccus salilacus]|uniref:alanyl-tRNA editing protein n=1 Tax=Halalkalicoccus salilacus TaxID=3117459 RepID=UPI00300F0919
MALTRAPAEPYVTEFEATVDRIDGREVVFDRTYFYAESGGQPADRGTVAGIALEDVQHRGDDVVHTLAEEPEFVAGERVACAVDPAFRTYCMRTHTASHVLYGAGRRLLDDLGYGGFDIDEEKARIDFETTTKIDDEALVELERLANRVVWESRPVSWEMVSAEEATNREEVAFNAKTEEGVFGDGEGVRIVTIGERGTGSSGGLARGSTASTASSRDEPQQRSADPATSPWDVAACGGTHVANTREIGPVTVLGRSNPGEGLTRVELAVGPSGIERRAETRRAALDAARTLGVRIEGLPDAAERQRNDVEVLEAERDDLLDRLAAIQLAAIQEDAIEHDGERWLVGVIEGVDGDTLADRARSTAGESAETVALVGDGNPATVAIASAGDTDASSLVSALTDEFGGGGGGGPEFAQGGGIDADPDEVVSFLRGSPSGPTN